MISSLRAQLSSAEDNFMTALLAGPTALQGFYESWSRVPAVLDAALDQQTIDDDTLSLAQNVVARIEILATQFAHLFEESDAITNTLEEESIAALSQLKIGSTAPTEEFTLEYLAPFKRAHDWLLENLHNPYPPKDVRAAIAKDNKSSIKDIDKWFSTARRRIGWNQLRSARFSNQRKQIVEAATTFFLSFAQPASPISNRSPSPSLSPYEADFLTIKYNAEELYKSNYSSNLTTASATESSYAYPSPAPSEHSCRSLPQTDFADASFDITGRPEFTSHKRSHSSSSQEDVDRPSKRIRKASADYTSSMNPSPLMLSSSQALSPTELLSTRSSSGKRKRCASDDQLQSESKRPCRPLPRSSSQISACNVPSELSAGSLLLDLSSENIKFELSDVFPESVSIAPGNEGPVDLDVYQFDFFSGQPELIPSVSNTAFFQPIPMDVPNIMGLSTPFELNPPSIESQVYGLWDTWGQDLSCSNTVVDNGCVLLAPSLVRSLEHDWSFCDLIPQGSTLFGDPFSLPPLHLDTSCNLPTNTDNWKHDSTQLFGKSTPKLVF